MDPDQFKDIDFGLCKILYKGEDISENLCLFASYTPLPVIPEYVFYYLNDIKNAGMSIVFISTSEICAGDVQRLSLLTNIVISKENMGTDFGSWCAALRWLDFATTCKTLYLCNDSVFVPWIPGWARYETFLN